MKDSQLHICNEFLMKADRIRDISTDSRKMFGRFVKLTEETLRADGVMLFVNSSKYTVKSGCCKDNSIYSIEINSIADCNIKKNQVIRSENFTIIARIIRQNSEILGFLYVFYLKKPRHMARYEEITDTIVSQLDSAIVQMRRMNALRENDNIIRIIYEIDRVRDKYDDFDIMMKMIIRKIQHYLQSHLAFLTVYDRRKGLFYVQTVNKQINRKIESNIIDFSSLTVSGSRVRRNRINGHYYAGIPLVLENNIIGVLGAVNINNAFSPYQIKVLKAVGSQTDTAIFENMQRKRLKDVLGRSVDPRVMNRMLRNEDTDFLNGEKMDTTVLYADIRGSTMLAEMIEPSELVTFINRYLSAMSEIAFNNKGTVDKFVGDEIMVLFGAPYKQNNKEILALKTALQMQDMYSRILKEFDNAHIRDTALGIGIATGDVIAGEMGYEKRTDYTIIGRIANLGARLCSDAGRGEILIDSSTWDKAGNNFTMQKRGTQTFKGINKPVMIFSVKGESI